ncbi:serine protease 33 [Channa argus]|uniref:serine protease 33 n=1 Tax=Channa argus TaxID=215402 RepID=UPI002945A288|nr:hypothetical protein Q8A73_021303 [Channa argus]
MLPKLLFPSIFCCLTGVLASYAQVCGRRPLKEDRIVGGMDASEGAWPWQVDVQTTKDQHICGGTIITENWVLSAAHCFPNPSEVSPYTIYVGRYQLNGLNKHQASYRVTRVVIPPGYTNPESGRDLALLQLSEPITWSDYAQPVCLPTSSTSFPPGMLCYVTGWGDIQNGVALQGAGTLQQVQVPIISQSSCQEMYQTNKDSVDILDDMVCAGFQEGGKDSCQGDSGGPLVCQMLNGTWVQAGVVSFGLGCAQTNHPGVYARLTSYSSFITNIIPDIELYSHAGQNSCGSVALLICSLSALLVLLQT